ncbi:uncharacterized protein EV422DRAFT_563587 [Fimicolochytrium jonesii]|uniref:uncharacterized protein n=1 Tax=Fimicolochytrium jonesii TaxID=1396493 RepID=UPI0022FF060B|nr:uncharacterized protein EV422DRAFT_563587 [Fimicolochytrium jonesii]KAI8825755.1 hypothetical protein EV422DRAFT_563587 [Fimicolochytrium jonesii]
MSSENVWQPNSVSSLDISNGTWATPGPSQTDTWRNSNSNGWDVGPSRHQVGPPPQQPIANADWGARAPNVHAAQRQRSFHEELLGASASPHAAPAVESVINLSELMSQPPDRNMDLMPHDLGPHSLDLGWDVNAASPSRPDGGRFHEMRKARSEFTLADRIRTRPDEDMDGLRYGFPDTNETRTPSDAKPPRQRRGTLDRPSRNDRDPGSRHSFASLKGSPFRDSPSHPRNDDGQRYDNARKGPPKTPSRLFTRQLEDVNKSLGGSSPLPKSPEKASSSGSVPAASQDRSAKRRRSRRGGKLADASKATGLLIYGFPKSVRVRELIQVFTEFGDIVNVGIVNPKSEHDMYAFVDYEETGCAERALKALSKKTLFDMTTPLELDLRFDASAADDTDFRIPAYSTGSLGRGGRPAPNTAGGATASNPDLDMKSLHLANLPRTVEKVDLDEMFASFGSITRLNIVNRAREKRAYAFVSFNTEKAARAAFEHIRARKVFGMAEPLRVDYAHRMDAASTPIRDTGRRGSFASVARSSRQKLERPDRQAIYIASMWMTPEQMVHQFTGFGKVKDHAVLKPQGPDDEHRSALVVFDNPEAAARAVAARALGAVFPRQRKVQLTDLPADLTEKMLHDALESCGEIQKVEIVRPADGATSASALMEFVRGEGAAQAITKCQSVKLEGMNKLVAFYAPTGNRKTENSGSGNSKDEDGESSWLQQRDDGIKVEQQPDVPIKMESGREQPIPLPGEDVVKEESGWDQPIATPGENGIKQEPGWDLPIISPSAEEHSLEDDGGRTVAEAIDRLIDSALDAHHGSRPVTPATTTDGDSLETQPAASAPSIELDPIIEQSVSRATAAVEIQESDPGPLISSPAEDEEVVSLDDLKVAINAVSIEKHVDSTVQQQLDPPEDVLPKVAAVAAPESAAVSDALENTQVPAAELDATPDGSANGSINESAEASAHHAAEASVDSAEVAAEPSATISTSMSAELDPAAAGSESSTA